MSTTLQRLLPAIEIWLGEDEEARAEAAREIEALRTGAYRLSPAEDAAVSQGLNEADDGLFADDARIRALWKGAGL